MRLSVIPRHPVVSSFRGAIMRRWLAWGIEPEPSFGIFCLTTRARMVSCFDHRRPAPLRPEEVSLLRQILEFHCEKVGLDRNSEQALQKARELIGFFQAGVSEQHCLVLLLERSVSSATAPSQDLDNAL
ncbi:conserved hypothetical protein [Rhizobium mesoamericanum STM3625]|uniref:Uncharacterized protein n=1 Tax=Rhizobium mesoamericanum STM3625 TaxID=1211777 RepID=K0Q0W4_9HYPH|nr:conserved hypothetical protein [Rhizobium mesoamericanum STM3625]